jgi:ligand-binding sensor domain-containing protein/signal transduction histidine kinase
MAAATVTALTGAGSPWALGQPAGVSPLASASPFVCRVWRGEDGLPQDSVWAILQARDGYLWVGTGCGLARFDGVSFKVFGMAEGMPSLHVRALLEDRQGALWIGTAKGVCRYAAGQFQSWTVRDGLAGDIISQLAEDPDGVIWIGTTVGLSRWSDGRFERIKLTEDPNDAGVRALAVDRNGDLWISMVKEGLRRRRGTGFVEVSGEPEFRRSAPLRLLKDRAGRMWVSGDGRVSCFDGTSWQVYGLPEGLPDVTITSLGEGADGTIWAGTTDQGLYFLRAGKFHAVRRADGLSDEAVRVILGDHENTLWVGTRGGGLNRLQPRKLLTRKIWDGQTEAQPFSLAESAEGVLWVGTMGRGLYQLDSQGQAPVLRDRFQVNNPQVSAVLVARDGSLWCSAGPSLFHWQEGQLSSVRGGSWVRCLCEDRQEGIWIGSQDGTLKLLKRGQLVDTSPFGPRGQLTSLVQERDGTLWVGTYGGGVGRLKDGRWAFFQKEQGLRSDIVQTLCLDSEGTLWIGTEGGGLGRFKDGRIVSFGKPQGLPEETILQILDDGAGYLWLGSYHGIFGVSRRVLDELTAGRASYVHARVFDRSDGLQSEECVGGFSTCLKTRSGLLCFATGSGIVMIDPKQPWDKGVPPAVWFEELLVDGQPQAWRPGRASSGELGGSPVRIPPGKSRFEFHYTGLNFSAPEKVRFRYQLEGLDSGWVEAGPRRAAYYSHLLPGNYRFRVQAHNGNSVWGESGASVALKVQPHFWETWWFIALTVVGLAGSVAATVRHLERRKAQAQLRRLEQDRATERERARIARDIHDDLGARLTQISALTEQAERETPSTSPTGLLVRHIRATAQETLSRLDETVWTVNPRNDRLDRLADYILNYAEEFFRHTSVRCRFKLLGDVPPLAMGAEPRHHLFLAVKEALNNAAKHSGATEVQVQIEFAAGAFRVSVHDNGSGFDAAACLARGRGLENMRSRLELLGGRLDLESQPGNGATIRMEFNPAQASQKPEAGVP